MHSALATALMAFGWVPWKGPSEAILATKYFATAAGTQKAYAYMVHLRKTGAHSLQGAYQWAGRNILVPYAQCIPSASSDREVSQLVAMFSAHCDEAVALSQTKLLQDQRDLALSL